MHVNSIIMNNYYYAVNIGAIVGGAVGGAVVLVVIILVTGLIFWQLS